MFPAVCGQRFTILPYSLVEREHGERPSGFWFRQKVLSRLLQQAGVAARPNLWTQLEIVHIILIELLAGNLRLFFCSATVLHDCLTHTNYQLEGGSSRPIAVKQPDEEVKVRAAFLVTIFFFLFPS